MSTAQTPMNNFAYCVQKNDTLLGVAELLTRDGRNWPDLLGVNPALRIGPDGRLYGLTEGMLLAIPRTWADVAARRMMGGGLSGLGLGDLRNDSNGWEYESTTGILTGKYLLTQADIGLNANGFATKWNTVRTDITPLGSNTQWGPNTTDWFKVGHLITMPLVAIEKARGMYETILKATATGTGTGKDGKDGKDGTGGTGKDGTGGTGKDGTGGRGATNVTAKENPDGGGTPWATYIIAGVIGVVAAGGLVMLFMPGKKSPEEKRREEEAKRAREGGGAPAPDAAPGMAA
jgi:hypothetical protein